MPNSTQPSRPMHAMDWLVVALVASAVIFPMLLASTDGDQRRSLEHCGNFLAAAGCLILLGWIWFADGAHSGLWRWLPPFWPWSRMLTTALPRQCLVILLVLGTVMAMLVSR